MRACEAGASQHSPRLIARRAIRPGKAALPSRITMSSNRPGSTGISHFAEHSQRSAAKVAASSEQRSRCSIGRKKQRSHFRSRRFSEVRHLERFLDLQFARFSMRINAAEIINTVRQVGILCTFADDIFGPMEWSVPAGTKKVVAVRTGCTSKRSSKCVTPVLREILFVDPGFSPSSNSAPAVADTACHISVFPRPPAAFSWAEHKRRPDEPAARVFR